MAQSCSMRSTPLRRKAKESRRSWVRWAGNACSQAVKYALTMISPFFGCGRFFAVKSIL